MFFWGDGGRGCLYGTSWVVGSGEGVVSRGSGLRLEVLPGSPILFSPQRTAATDQRQAVQQRRQQLMSTKTELQQQGAEEEPRKV